MFRNHWAEYLAKKREKVTSWHDGHDVLVSRRHTDVFVEWQLYIHASTEAVVRRFMALQGKRMWVRSEGRLRGSERGVYSGRMP